MGQLRLLLLLYYRPLRAMSGIIDEGSLLLGAGLVLVASVLTSAALASQMLRALPAEAARVAALNPDLASGLQDADVGDSDLAAEPSPDPRRRGSVPPNPYGPLASSFFSATSSLSTLFALALLYAPCLLLLLTIFEPIGSFGVAFRSNFGPFLACILMAWAAARIPLALLAIVVPASMTTAALLWLASLVYFSGLAACAARIVFGAGAIPSAAAATVSWAAMALEPFLLLLASPFLAYYAYQFIRGDIGDVLWSFGARQDFKRHLQAATINPRDAEAHYQLGLIHLQRRQLDEAADRFARAVAIDPREIDARYQLGRLARQQGRLEDARQHFDAVVTRDDRHASHEVWREIGATYLDSDSFEHAKWALDKFVAARPHDPEGLYRLGVAMQRVGEEDAAREMFRRAVESVDTMPRYLQRKAGPWRKMAAAALSTEARRTHGA